MRWTTAFFKRQAELWDIQKKELAETGKWCYAAR
jgi:hypothetical protein